MPLGESMRGIPGKGLTEAEAQYGQNLLGITQIGRNLRKILCFFAYPLSSLLVSASALLVLLLVLLLLLLQSVTGIRTQFLQLPT